jgi:dienelactone hydrolase
MSMSRASVSVGPLGLSGLYESPLDARGLVVFAHGSGSSRSSPRNQAVARALHAHAMATLLFDLLTEDEAADRRKVFDIALLAERVVDAIDWLGTSREGSAGGRLGRHPLGLFGASTGAAAALGAAAERPLRVFAVVSRGGRPDLAPLALPQVRAPTLLIVGGLDHEVLRLNREAFDALRCEKRLQVVDGATHLFEEPGSLERVARLAGDWFVRHCPGAAADA